MINGMLAEMVNGAPEPKVGEFCTELLYTDRKPYTITKVISPTEIEVVADKVKWDATKGPRELGDNRFWVMESDPNGAALTLVKAKNGKWLRKGAKVRKDSVTFAMGRRDFHHDDSF